MNAAGRGRAQPPGRERRKSVRDLSSEWYWEQDKQYRFTQIKGRAFANAGLEVQAYLGAALWDRGGLPVADDGSWEKHKTALEARQPFADFLFKCSDRHGQLRYISSSGQPVFDSFGRFRGYRGFAQDVSERVRTELRLTIEHGITRMLAELNSITEVGPKVIRLICETLGWACGARWEVDAQSKLAHCAETWGVAAPQVEAFLQATTDLRLRASPGGLARRTWVKGEPVWLHDVTKESTFLRAQRAVKCGLHSAFAFPIKAGAQVIGVMEFFSQEIYQPDAELLNATRYIGSQIGQFIQRKQAEEALRENEQLFHNTFEYAPIGILHVDLDGRILRTNRRTAEILGYAQSELAGRSVRDFAAPEDPEVTSEIVALRKLLYAGQIPSITKERRFVRKDGSRAWTQLTITVLRDSAGKPLYDNTTVEDIGERKRAERVLRENEAYFRSLTELSSDWYWEQDENLRFTKFSGGSLGQTGMEAAGLIGKTLWETPELIAAASAKAAVQAKMQAREAFYDFEYKQTGPDGTFRYITTNGTPVCDTTGRFVGYRGIAKDITERRRAEQLQALEHAVNRCLAEAKNASEAIKTSIRAMCETEGWECGRYFRVDRKAGVLRFAEAWGLLDPLIERYIAASEGLTYGMGKGITGRVWQTGEPVWVSDRGQHAGLSHAIFGSTRDTFIFPLLADGKAVGVLSFTNRQVRPPDARLLQAIRVIGGQIGQFVQRKEAEEVLRESEARFRSLTNLSSDWFWEQDAESRFTQFEGTHISGDNAAFQDEIGKTSAEIGVEVEGGSEDHLALLRAHKPFRDVLMWRAAKDGQRYYMSISGEPVFDDRGRFLGYRGLGKDITDRKREEQLVALEHAVSRCFANAEEVAGALTAVLRAVCESEGWECGRYFRADEKAGVLRLADAWSVPGELMDRFIKSSREITYIPGAGSIGQVWQSGQPQWVPDIAKDSDVYKGVARNVGMHGALFFPVLSNRKAIGVISFHSREAREPDSRLVQTISVIGSQIGQFVQRKEAQEVLRESEARFRSLTSLSSDWYWEQDTEFRFTRFEGRTGTEHFGEDITGTNFIGKRYWETGVEIEDEGGWGVHRALLEAHEPFRDVIVRRPALHGRCRYFSLSGEPVFDRAGGFAGYRGVASEITERKLAEERIQYLATHDALTDLPNRAMFSQVLNLAIQSARRYDRHFAVLFLDLDRFKIINDTLGHEAGDTLLQEMARRLKGSLRSSDVVARLGGDEFVVLVQEVTEPEQVATVARKLLSTVIRPVMIMDQECRVTASIGVSMFPTDALDEQALMKNADMAMYLAKEEGKNNFQFYSKGIKTQSLERLTLEMGLRHGLEREEFFLHYQAKLDLATGVITGVEALLRWQHPDRGMVSPAQFIPLAEETGLIVPIGKWVLKTACAQNVAWQRAGLPPVCVAVNLSPRQFVDENLLADLAAVLEETGMDPKLLELEITESMVMGNVDRAAKQLAAIKHMGMRLAIDDFGTGYSSLAQIKRFPIDTIKVDRSFIREIPQDAEDKAITQAIIAMGKSLSLTVVAEGVETQEQQMFLCEHACNEMQGYYFSKPVGPDEFAELLRTHVATPCRATSG